MKTRSMNVFPDEVQIEGSAWGRELPKLVFKQYEDGEVVRKVSIEIRPVDIEDIARALWEIRGKYQSSIDSMTRSLKGE